MFFSLNFCEMLSFAITTGLFYTIPPLFVITISSIVKKRFPEFSTRQHETSQVSVAYAEAGVLELIFFYMPMPKGR